LSYYHSCLADPIEDTDGQEIDIPALIQSASGEYQISPTLLLAIMESQSQAISQCPDANALAGLMGLASPETARGQIASAAEILSLSLDALIDDGTTPNGWKTDVPKTTLDGVSVIPANDAITLLFDYLQLAGSVWGGDQLDEPGVHGVYIAWRDYRLDKPLFQEFHQYFLPVLY
jgi:hypothetical protein